MSAGVGCQRQAAPGRGQAFSYSDRHEFNKQTLKWEKHVLWVWTGLNGYFCWILTWLIMSAEFLFTPLLSFEGFVCVNLSVYHMLDICRLLFAWCWVNEGNMVVLKGYFTKNYFTCSCYSKPLWLPFFSRARIFFLYSQYFTLSLSKKK